MKLGETLDQFYKREEIHVAREMIDFQRNDYVVSTLNSLFKELCTEVKGNLYIKKSGSMHKDGKCLEILNKIDYTLKERFGLTFKHVACNGFGYAVLVSSPKDIDAISGQDHTGMKEELDKELKRWRFKEHNAKKKEDVQELDPYSDTGKDNLHILYHYRNSLTELRNKMKTDNVFVDRKKAKIVGLPNEYIAYVLHDLYTYITKADMTPEEITAVLLHEVGHAFTYIEYSYRSVSNCSVLMDTFLENMNKKNKTPKESLILAYEKISKGTDSNTKDLRSKNAVSATIYVIDSFVKQNMLTLTGSTHPSVDSEQLADQFSGRFGCSAELASGLEKLYAMIYKEIRPICIWNITVLIFYTLLSIAVAASGIGMGIFLTLFFGLLSVYYIHYYITLETPEETDPGYINTYDSLKRRYTRMRNELVRNLRGLELPDKNVKEQLLISIDRLDAILDTVPDERVPFMDSVVRFFSKSARHRVEIRIVEQLIEDLSENNLHVAAAKIQSKL